MLNLCNFTGRVGWGLVSDKIGRKTFYLAATAAQTFAIGLMAVWIDRANFGAWLLSFLLIGSLYGGGEWRRTRNELRGHMVVRVGARAACQ